MRKALRILGILSDPDIDWIARNSFRRIVEAGGILIQQGVAIDHLYIVIEGQFEVRIGPAQETLVATLLSGEIIGEISFVDHRPPASSVRATQTSTVLALPRAALQRELAVDPRFAARFYLAVASFLADRLFASTARLGFGSVTQESDPDVLNEAQMDEISMGALRFDKLLRTLANAPETNTLATRAQ